MRVFDEMTTIQGRVEAMLEKWPHLRDDDFKLIATFWKFEAEKMGVDLESITAKDFLRMFADGNFSHSESVRRLRAKLQADNERLRGKAYKRRQDDAESFRNEING